MTITDDTAAKLREVAEKATPGPWNASSDTVNDFGREYAGSLSMEFIGNMYDEDDAGQVAADAAYIATFNPQTVLAVLDELDHFRAFAKEATAKMTNYAGGGSELFHSERYGMFLADIEVCIERYRRRFQTQQSAITRAVQQRQTAESAIAGLTQQLVDTKDEAQRWKEQAVSLMASLDVEKRQREAAEARSTALEAERDALKRERDELAEVGKNTAHTLAEDLKAAERERDEARAALCDFMVITEPSSIPAFEDPLYGEEVAELGHRIGFGALISSASASWRKSLEKGFASGGEFVVGPCMSVLIHCRTNARAVLARTGKPTDE